jgi:hypothetical protein
MYAQSQLGGNINSQAQDTTELNSEFIFNWIVLGE